MVNSDRLKETEIFQDLTYEELDKIAVICIRYFRPPSPGGQRRTRRIML